MGESIPVLIQFDPSYKDDFVTRTAESQLEVAFKEHPQKVNRSILILYLQLCYINLCPHLVVGYSLGLAILTHK